jgi:hypothetical protein
LLAKRLAQRGVVFSGSVAAVLSAGLASGSAPPALVASTIKAASLLAAGQAAGVVSAKIAALTEGVVQAMFVTKIKSVLAVVLVVGLALAGAGLIYQSQAADLPKDSNKVVQAPKPGEKEAPAPALPDEKTAPKEQKVLTPDEALKLRSKEKVTVQFKVKVAEVYPNLSQANLYYPLPIPHIRLTDGGTCTVTLAPPVREMIIRLGIDPVKHFTGKVIRVTGMIVQNTPQGPGCYIVVHDLSQLTVVVGE